MDWDTANRIHRSIKDAQFDDPHGLREDFYQRATRYARIRVDWLRSDRETRNKMDAERTAAHNTFIDACDILSRQMNLRVLDISWRADLGENRKEIGDFACFIHCILGIEAR